MKKRLISLLVLFCLALTLLPPVGGIVFASDTVSRAEWISSLVSAFSMTVESDDNMPDNYFSDLTEDNAHYRDILLAVEFGVIDIEAGEAFTPDEPATREFAAQTLNACLLFQLDEGADYTFAESVSIAYPDDIQVAINRNWFALSGNKFLPEQPITTAESSAMLANAAAVLAADNVDENYNSTYQFAAGVVEIPKDTDVKIAEDYTVTITDYTPALQAGDLFVVYYSGYPVALKALSVTTEENVTTITATTDGTDGAITVTDSEGVIDVDLEDFEFNELTTYSVIDTSNPQAQNEDLGIELASIDYNKNSKTLTASQKISLGSAAAGSVSVKLSNLKLHHKENVNTGVYEVYITADSSVTTAVSFDFGSYAGIPSSITLGYVNIGGIGSVALELECSFKGGVSMTWNGNLKAGASYVRNSGFHLIKSYTKKDFTFTAEAEIKTGLKLSAGLDLVLIKGGIWGTVGVKMNFNLKSYNSGLPKTCVTIGGYMYASVGASITIDYVLDQKTWSKTQDIFTSSNSPVRVLYHYEDNVLVGTCSRGDKLDYTTAVSSRYFNPSPSYGQGSYGGSGSGDGSAAVPVVIWEYRVESDGNATITHYNGTATAIAIPSKIDGYTVTKIGASAFGGCTNLRTVVIPDSVIELEQRVFTNCTNLSSVKLSTSLEKMASDCFRECTSLTSIEIPASLKECVVWYGDGGGPFYKCSALNDVTFEHGTTRIVGNLFKGCTGLRYINIPDTVTEIGGNAFYDCTSLVSITLPDSIMKIGDHALKNCIMLEQINMPNSIVTIESYAFENTGLKRISLPPMLQEVTSGLFYRCKNLADVTIPNTVKYIRDSAFYECTSLAEIDLPNVLIAIGTSAFYASGLTQILIPESVTGIGGSAFYNCDKLKTATINGSGKIYENTFMTVML